MTKYLIVGASAGAVGAVEGIRTLDPSGDITVVSEEMLAPYSRPSIGECLDGKIDEDSIRFGPSDFWERNAVKPILGRKAVTLDLQAKKVRLDNGEDLGFDKLLLAMGARPIVPKMSGLDKEGFCTFTSISDISKIKTMISGAHQSVVIGGGLIGVAAAEALTNLGVEVTIVELRGWLLNLVLNREAAKIVEDAIQERGIKVVTGQSVQEVVGKDGDNSKVGGVILSNGKRLTCDLVIAAIGVMPRTELAIQAGLKVNRGIVVNRFMETSTPSVYACGDVAEAYEYLKGVNQVLIIWPLARLGGRVAGLNMAGDRVEYPGGTPMSALRYFDIPLISVGISPMDDMSDCEVIVAATKKTYKQVVLRKEEIVGFTLINDVGSAGLLNNLMQTRTNVSKLKGKLFDEDFSFIHLPEQLRRRTLMEAWT